MGGINRRRVWLGTLVGGVVWAAWDFVINACILAPRYQEAQQAGHFLAAPRYGFFMGTWLLIIFLLSYIVAMLYASMRATCGAGPRTALAAGVAVGFAAGFPSNYSMATWATFDRIFPLWWMLDLGVGAVLAALLAGWLYREQAA